MRIEFEEQLDALQFDERGLVPVIAQHATTGEVLMLAYADRSALERTLATNQLWLYSRSRQQLWHKGETSGHVQYVLELHADCDGDTLLARVIPAGPACHTGTRNCFETAPTLRELADVIAQRAQSGNADSYTARLFSNQNLRLKKLGEEVLELALACQAGDSERVREEAADLVYHLLVAAAAARVDLEEVLAELDERLSGRGALRSAGERPSGAEPPPGWPGPETEG
ncbi:MAG: bifunctional phosphoribosyl-AMP cyclohydrolase/phosphoribosyl-ATP diphosphatase HisIE [Longimicrobiales bacterium]